MNDLNKPISAVEKQTGSRRPMWRSLKVVTTKVGIPVDSSNLRKSMDPPSHSANNTTSGQVDDDFITANTNTTTPKAASIKSVDYKKTRLSSWLSQQVHEHQGNTLCSPSWVDDREPATMSNLSLVSHASSINGNNAVNGRKRSSSLPTAPSASTPRVLLQPVNSNNPSTTPPLSPQPVPAQVPLIITTPAAMMYPSSTTSTVSDHSPLTTPAIMDDHSFTHSCGTLPLSANTSIRHHDERDYGVDHNCGDSDDDDETYTTASGANSYMDHQRDDINENASNHSYGSDNQNNNNINEINSVPSADSSDNQRNGTRNRHRTSSMQALYVNSVVDAMDPEVAQVLLEWRRQSLLNIDWFDLFSVKSEIWCSSTIFHLHPTQTNPSHQHDHQSSSRTSIATSLISLDYKGIPLDKAFRSYSDKIDYAKASVLDIDQALKIFAQLYWECNPSPLFQCAELVYAVVHSLLLLVTGIHTGKERITANEFCDRTMDLISGHQASTSYLHFGMNDDNIWQQSMIEYLLSLYKSFSKSSVFSMGRPHLHDSMIYYQRHHHQQEQEHHPNQEPKFSSRLEAAFDNMFINRIESQDNVPAAASTQPTLALQKKQKRSRRRRSKSLHSTPSWTLVRRRDTYRTKIGPSKEGPLQCQLNGEEWKICWVILHHGHLYLYHHHKDGSYPILHHPLTTTSSSSLHLEASNRIKFKQKFMHHLISSSASSATTSANNMSPAASHGQLKKKEPYQVVDIYLGNAFCEKIHSHAFLLQLVNGNSYVFDCGSENHVASWVQACNYWSARETKIVLSRGLLAPLPSPATITNDSSLLFWKRPPPPAGASVLDKKGQQEAIDTHLLYLQTELKTLLQHEPGSSILPAWHNKKMYLELEIRKYQCYHDSIYS